MSAALGPEPVWLRRREPPAKKACAVEVVSYSTGRMFCGELFATTDDMEPVTPSDLERCSLCRSRVALKTSFVRVQCSQLGPVEENVVELTVEDFDEEADTPSFEYPPGFGLGGDAG